MIRHTPATPDIKAQYFGKLPVSYHGRQLYMKLKVRQGNFQGFFTRYLANRTRRNKSHTSVSLKMCPTPCVQPHCLPADSLRGYF